MMTWIELKEEIEKQLSYKSIPEALPVMHINVNRCEVDKIEVVIHDTAKLGSWIEIKG